MRIISFCPLHVWQRELFFHPEYSFSCGNRELSFSDGSSAEMSFSWHVFLLSIVISPLRIKYRKKVINVHCENIAIIITKKVRKSRKIKLYRESTLLLIKKIFL